jgi:hypothetical protein
LREFCSHLTHVYSVIGKRNETFNPLRSEMWDQIKRIKVIKLFPRKLIGKEKEMNHKYFVLGGIKVIYELESGETDLDALTSRMNQSFWNSRITSSSLQSMVTANITSRLSKWRLTSIARSNKEQS